MKNPFHFKYPDINPLLTATPEQYQCPECHTDIEIWSDEIGGRCRSCSTYFKKAQLRKSSCTFSSSMNSKFKELIQVSYKLGASNSAIISANDIIVDVSLADKCREPRCANYGLSKNCPPHISGPSGFKKNLETFNKAIFFKIDVPSEILYSSENREVFQLLHQIAAGIESSAVKLGFENAQAYAGGSCKKIFCYNYNECLALTEKQKCRHPEYARSSMSGFGINVAKLFETTGWTMTWVTDNNDSNTTKMGNVCGLVLIC